MTPGAGEATRAREETSPPAAAGEEAVIRVEGLRLAFDDVPVLTDVDFELRRGEILCILGGSGSGKSTILRLILGLVAPDAGRIWACGQEITGASVETLREVRREIGMVFQASALFDSLSVFDNVAFPLREFGERSPEEIEARVEEALRIVDLDPDQVAEKLPAQLSGGMKKRVGIARAIVARPPVLLFDEPTGGLDPTTTRTINRLIVKLREELRVSTIVVTHDIHSAFGVADRAALLADGQLVFIGTPAEMRASDAPVVRRFLGRDAGEGDA